MELSIFHNLQAAPPFGELRPLVCLSLDTSHSRKGVGTKRRNCSLQLHTSQCGRSSVLHVVKAQSDLSDPDAWARLHSCERTADTLWLCLVNNLREDEECSDKLFFTAQHDSSDRRQATRSNARDAPASAFPVLVLHVTQAVRT